MPYDLIEQEIVNALTAFGPIAVANNYSDRDCTQGVKVVLGAIGRNRGYKIFSSIQKDNNRGLPFDQIRQQIQPAINLEVPDRDQFLGEWLYDILWWHGDDQRYIIECPLVAESEWGGNNAFFKDDFPKLLLARSEHRIVIFEGYPPPDRENNVAERINWCKEQIRNFSHTQKGDRYLFCAWQWGKQEFLFDLFIAP